MSDKGWIKFYRDLQDHWLWEDKPFAKGQAWLDLIALADYETKRKPYKGKMKQFNRGDVNISITALAGRWGWSRDKVRRFLMLLESDGMVRTKSTPNNTAITIVKYGFFQGQSTVDKAVDNTADKALNRQQTATPKNIKNIKNKKEKEYTPAVPDPEVDDDEGMDPREFHEKLLRGEIKFE